MTASLSPDNQHRIANHAHKTVALCTRASSYVADQDLDESSLANALNDVSEAAAVLAQFLNRSSTHADVMAEAVHGLLPSCVELLGKVEQDHPPLKRAYAAVLHLGNSCEVLLGEKSPESLDPSSDAGDAALKGTFPASDPATSPSEI